MTDTADVLKGCARRVRKNLQKGLDLCSRVIATGPRSCTGCACE